MKKFFQSTALVPKNNQTDYIDAEWYENEQKQRFNLRSHYQIVAPAHRVIRVRPDTSARNWHTEDIAKSITDAFKIPLDRFYFEDGWKLRYRQSDRATWEIDYTQGSIDFLLTVPGDRVDSWIRRLSGIWDKSTITVDGDCREAWEPDKATVYELVYRKHDMYSLLADSKNNLPLPSLLQAVKTLHGTDKAKVFIFFDPVGRLDWNATYQEAWEMLRNGRQPLKRNGDASGYLRSGLTCTGQLMQEVMVGLGDMIKSDKQENRYAKKEVDPEAGLFAIENLTSATKRKGGMGAMRTYLWIVAQSDDRGSRESTARTLAGAFADLVGDNEFEAREVKNRKKKAAAIEAMTTKRLPKLKFNYSILSTAESGKLIQIPGRELQEDYPQINGIKLQEITLPAELFGTVGIPLGKVTDRGVTRQAMLPISDPDIECKTEIDYGNMGCGKTGRGIVLAVEGVKNNRTVFLFDMADGAAIDAVRDSLPSDTPDHKILDLDFGCKHWPIPLTLTDVALRGMQGESDELAALDAAERMTDYIYTFINQLASSEFSDRMEYFLSPVGKGVLTDPRRGLLDVVLALSSPVYREELLQDQTIQQQSEVVDVLRELQQKAVKGSDKTLVQPILDRLNLLAGKRTLVNIFLQQEKLGQDGKPVLDFRKMMDEGGYFVGLRIPKAELGKDGVNRVASFLMAKIWLATLSRLDTPQSKRRPFYTIIDEPHNCLEGTGPLLDGEIGVEARKYRNKMIFLAHSAEQFGKYKAGIYAGGPFFNFFKTEFQKTFIDHAEKLTPLEARKLYEQLPKRWVAACKMELPSADSLPAFICHMTAPPRPVKDRSYRRSQCSEYFGRHWKEVTDYIQGKRKITLRDEAWREERKEEAKAQKKNKKGD